MHARHASRQLPAAPSFAFPRITEIGASPKASLRAPAHAMVHEIPSVCMKKHARTMLHATRHVHVHAACRPDSCAGVSTDTFFQGEMTAGRGLRGTNVPAEHKQSLKYNSTWLGWRSQACPTHPNKLMAKRHQNHRTKQKQNPRGDGSMQDMKRTDCWPQTPSRLT